MILKGFSNSIYIYDPYVGNKVMLVWLKGMWKEWHIWRKWVFVWGSESMKRSCMRSKSKLKEWDTDTHALREIGNLIVIGHRAHRELINFLLEFQVSFYHISSALASHNITCLSILPFHGLFGPRVTCKS